MDTKRIEALSDGVFAIAMTILVLEVHVPQLPRPLSPGSLGQALWHLAPSILAYGISFVILGTLWVGQHNQHHFLRRADRNLLWLNILFLSFISFLPFGTALLAKYADQPLAAAVYGGTLLCAGGLLYAQWAYATRGRRLVDANLPEAVVRGAERRILLGMGVYATAVVLSFVQPILGIALFALMPLAYVLPGAVDRHWRHDRDREA